MKMCHKCDNKTHHEKKKHQNHERESQTLCSCQFSFSQSNLKSSLLREHLSHVFLSGPIQVFSKCLESITALKVMRMLLMSLVQSSPLHPSRVLGDDPQN